MENTVNGVAYPTVSLAGKEYTIRINSGAIVRLKSLFQMEFADVKKHESAADNISQTCKILYATIGHRTGLTFEAFCDEIPLPDLTVAAEAINEALLKVSAQATPKVEAPTLQ